MSDSAEQNEPETPPNADAANPGADGSASDAPDAEPPAPRPPWKRPWLFASAGILVVALVGAAALFLMLNGGDDTGHGREAPPCSRNNRPSCGTTSQPDTSQLPTDPTALARSYAAAFSRHDLDAIERHVCADDQPMVRTYRAIREQFEKNGVTIEVTGTATETGDTATVPTTTTERTPTGQTNVTNGPLKLVKENGAWKVCNAPRTARPTWSDMDACTLLTTDEVARYLGGGQPTGARENVFDRPACVWQGQDPDHVLRLYLWKPPVPDAITENAKRRLTIASKPAYVRSESESSCAIDVDAGQGFVTLDVTAVNVNDPCTAVAGSLTSVINRLNW